MNWTKYKRQLYSESRKQAVQDCDSYSRPDNNNLKNFLWTIVQGNRTQAEHRIQTWSLGRIGQLEFSGRLREIGVMQKISSEIWVGILLNLLLNITWYIHIMKLHKGATGALWNKQFPELTQGLEASYSLPEYRDLDKNPEYSVLTLKNIRLSNRIKLAVEKMELN